MNRQTARLSASPSPDFEFRISSFFEEAAAIVDNQKRWEQLHSVGDLLETLNDVYIALAICSKLEPSFDQRHMLIGIVERWTELNPEEAAVWAESQPVDPKGQNALRLEALETVAGKWAETDPENALAWARSLANENESWQTSRTIFNQWAQGDPQKMATWIDSELDAGGSSSSLGLPCLTLAKTWARQDGSAAANWANKLPENYANRMRTLQAVMLFWAKTDVNAAKEFLDNSFSGGERLEQNVRAILASALTKENPYEALLIAESMTGKLRKSRVITAAEVLAQTDPEKAYHYLFSLPAGSDLRGAIAPYVSAGLAGGDIAKAITILDKMGVSEILTLDELWQVEKASGLGDDYEEGLKILVETCSGADPAGTLGWLINQDGILDERKPLLMHAIGSWVEQDAVSAAEWSLKQPGQIRQDIVAEVVKTWVNKDADATLAFLVGLAEDSIDDRTATDAVETAVNSMAGQQPEKAVLLAQSFWPVLADETRQSVISVWASSDPTAAAGWIKQLPEGGSRNAGISPLVKQWFYKSPSAVAVWVDSLADGQAKQIAINELNRLKEEVE